MFSLNYWLYIAIDWICTWVEKRIDYLSSKELESRYNIEGTILIYGFPWLSMFTFNQSKRREGGKNDNCVFHVYKTNISAVVRSPVYQLG